MKYYIPIHWSTWNFLNKFFQLKKNKSTILPSQSKKNTYLTPYFIDNNGNIVFLQTYASKHPDSQALLDSVNSKYYYYTRTRGLFRICYPKERPPASSGKKRSNLRTWSVKNEFDFGRLLDSKRFDCDSNTPLTTFKQLGVNGRVIMGPHSPSNLTKLNFVYYILVSIRQPISLQVASKQYQCVWPSFGRYLVCFDVFI